MYLFIIICNVFYYVLYHVFIIDVMRKIGFIYCNRMSLKSCAMFTCLLYFNRLISSSPPFFYFIPLIFHSFTFFSRSNDSNNSHNNINKSNINNNSNPPNNNNNNDMNHIQRKSRVVADVGVIDSLPTIRSEGPSRNMFDIMVVAPRGLGLDLSLMQGVLQVSRRVRRREGGEGRLCRGEEGERGRRGRRERVETFMIIRVFEYV